MNATRAERPSAWPLVLALTLIVAALAAMFWLRSRLVESQHSVLDGIVRRFELTDVLGRPESTINFRDVEILAQASENNLVPRIYVTKLLADAREVSVVPFSADLVQGDWRTRERWLRRPVGDPPAGYLYLEVNYSSIHAVNAVIAVLGALLVAGLAILLLRQRGQERKVGILQDEVRSHRTQVIRLERLALAGQLSANVFHDIKKPVLNIKHEISDALDSGEPPDREILRNVQEQTELFATMLRELGMESFSSATDSEQEWCDIGEAIERSLRLVEYERGAVVIESAIDEAADLLINGYPHRFVQLISNLILNAFQAMNREGTLRVAASRADDRIVVEIEDSGPGIPPAKREELFSPFVTTRADSGGTGLGLYICRMIVEEHGGAISIGESHRLGGALFIVVLPAH